MEEQKIGEILSYVREKAQIPRKYLCNGLCNKKTLWRIENGESRGEKWLIEALFSRMGKTTVHFEHYLNKEEYKLQEMRIRMRQALQENNKKELSYRIVDYEKQKGTAGVLHRQFVMCMRAYLCEGQGQNKERKERLKEALSYTVPDMIHQKLDQLFFSTDEMCMAIQLANAQEKEGDVSGAFDLRMRCFEYLWQDWVDEEIKLVFLPPLGLRLVKQLYMQREFSLLQTICTKMKELLKNNHELFTLPEIMEYQVKAMCTENPRLADTSFCQKELMYARILSNTRKEFGFSELTSKSDAVLEEMEMALLLRSEGDCHFIGEDIQIRRKAQGLKQSELCEGICTIRALSAIEGGKSTPQEVIYLELMKRLGVNDIFYGRYVDVSNFSADGKRFRLEKYIRHRVYKKAAELFEELKVELTNGKADRQYLVLIQTILDVQIYELPPERALEKFEEALGYSLKDYQKQDLCSWCLSRNEVKLLNSIASMHEKLGNLQDGICILSDIRDHYEKSKINIRYHLSQYNLIIRNLGKFLGEAGKHEEAISLADSLICLSFQWGNCDFLAASLYSNVWNMIEKRKKTGGYSEEDEKACKKYLKQAFCVADVMEDYQMIKFIKDYYKEVFQKSLILDGVL